MVHVTREWSLAWRKLDIPNMGRTARLLFDYGKTCEQLVVPLNFEVSPGRMLGSNTALRDNRMGGISSKHESAALSYLARNVLVDKFHDWHPEPLDPKRFVCAYLLDWN